MTTPREIEIDDAVLRDAMIKVHALKEMVETLDGEDCRMPGFKFAVTLVKMRATELQSHVQYRILKLAAENGVDIASSGSIQSDGNRLFIGDA